jgi:hypothetical protein
MLANQLEHAIDLIFVGANHQRRVAAPKETSGAGEARGAKFILEQCVDDSVRVFILNDRDDQLHHAANPTMVLTSIYEMRPSITLTIAKFGSLAALIVAPTAACCCRVEEPLQHDRGGDRVDSLTPLISPRS